MRLGGGPPNDNTTACRAAGACCCCTSLVAFLVLAGFSIGSVGPTQLALKSNTLNKQVSDRTFGPGRYWIWPWCTFLYFPRTVKSLEFSNRPGANQPPLDVRTTDKLGVKLHIAFQYQLQPQHVRQLYKDFVMNYERIFIQYAKQDILNAAKNYKAQDYWLQREAFGSSMKALTQNALNKAFANCTDLQLLLIVLPADYEKTIEQTQVTKQNTLTREKIKEAKTVRADIGVMVSEFQREITITLNQANADGLQDVRESEAEAAKLKIGAETKALNSARKHLKLSSKGLVEYQRLFGYQANPNATFLFGVDTASAWIPASRSKTVALHHTPQDSCDSRISAPAERILLEEEEEADGYELVTAPDFSIINV